MIIPAAEIYNRIRSIFMSHSLSKKFTFGSLLMFAMPTTIMMVVMSLYTIVDGVFVSRYVSTNALSSINIVYPIINIVLGLSVMLSTGSSASTTKGLAIVNIGGLTAGILVALFILPVYYAIMNGKKERKVLDI